MYRWQMTNQRTRLFSAALALCALVSFAGGCSSAQQTASDGEKAFEAENWDAAVYFYLQALADEPDNTEYKLNLTFARQKASARHFQRGTMLRELGRLKAARDELQMVVQLDPTNQFAAQLLGRVQEEIEILGRPDHEGPFLVLVVGYPEEGAQVPDIQKKPLEDIATFVE